jgi:uncharacterized lipoprotein YddW (UPF0748 family)
MGVRRWIVGVVLALGLSVVSSGCTLVAVAPAPPAPGGGEGVPVSPPPPPDPLPIPDALPTPFPAAAAPEDPREVRALWVVRTTLVHPDSIRAMVSRAASAGFNTLLVQVRGRGDAWYVGGPDPRAALLAGRDPGFDPLASVIEEAHRQGLEVHAWVNTHLVSSAVTLPTDPRHLLLRNPHWLAVPRALGRELARVDPADPAYVERLARYARENMQRVEGIYTSPSHPEVVEHVLSVWRHLLANYPVDGVHLDYIRYASPEFDYSPVTTAAFREWMAPRVSEVRRGELDRASAQDPLAWPLGEADGFDAFRRDAVSGLVERLAREARASRPGIPITAAVFPDAAQARRDRFQDWGEWLRQGWVDRVLPMAYTNDEGRYRAQVRDAVSVMGGHRVWAGVGIYQTTFQGAVRKLEIAREEGAGGIALFSYDWAVAEGGRVSGGVYLDQLARESFTGR